MDKIAILDFGGQYTHLIANRIRRLNVYSEILPPNSTAGHLAAYNGVVLSGGPNSVTDPSYLNVDSSVFDLGVPILGLCYGHQLMAQVLGGTIKRSENREYGLTQMRVLARDPIFGGLEPIEQIWMSHGDSVEQVPNGFSVLGSTADCAITAMGDSKRLLFGLQFHPEVTDTPHGMKILDNFLKICSCSREWDSTAHLEEVSSTVRKKCAGKKVFLLVSGGVDSTVTFTLLNEALGPDNVLGLHIDNGLMRYRESEEIQEHMKEHGFDNLLIEDARQEFLDALVGIIDPEEKRVLIGDTFIKVQQRVQEELGLNTSDWILSQGTIYPDTIESAGSKDADKIKTHHNRVEVILEMIEKGLVVEPLAHLYKDEVRQLGEKLSIPHRLLWRHPFPGPALGVRVLCSDGKTKVPSIEAYQTLQALVTPLNCQASILPVCSVGVQGDSRSYAYPALITGDRNWTVLEEVSTEITNKIDTINRVTYRVFGTTSNYRLVRASVTEQRLHKLRRVDQMVTDELHERDEYDLIWQMPIVLLPLIAKARII